MNPSGGRRGNPLLSICLVFLIGGCHDWRVRSDRPSLATSISLRTAVHNGLLVGFVSLGGPHILRFVLDTGAGAASYLYHPGTDNRLDTLFPHTARVVGLDGSMRDRPMGRQEVMIQTTGDEWVRLGPEMIVLLPRNEHPSNGSPGFDGVLAFSYFRNHVVELDFRDRVLRLHDGLPASLADGCGNAFTIDESLRPYVEVTVASAIEATTQILVLLDTGNNAALTVPPDVARTLHLRNDAPGIVGLRLGGRVSGRVDAVASLHVGRCSMSEVPTVVLPHALRSQRGITIGGQVGAGVLRHYTIWLDYPRRSVVVVPHDGD